MIQTRRLRRKDKDRASRVVANGKQHYFNLPPKNKNDLNKENKQKESHVSLAEGEQRLPEVSVKVGNSPPNSAYTEVRALIETN